MYIANLELENIRSFKKLNIDLSRHINLITGPNNSGKSTIIKSIYKLQEISSLTENDIRTAENNASILYRFESVSDSDFEFLTKRSRINYSGNGYPVHITFEFNPHSVAAKYIGSEGRPLSLDELRTGGFFTERGQFHPLPKKENESNFIYPFFAKRKTNYYSSQGGFEETYAITEDLRNLPSRIQKISNPSHPRNKEFQEYCNDILGFSIGVIPFRGKENTVGIFAKDDSPISIESMGEGVVNIVGLITILLTFDNKLFLIEELENDIHPEALKKLLNLIIEKAEHNQFIISTHSNIVLKYLGSLPETKIFYTEWKPFEEQNRYGYNIPTSSIEEVENNSEERLKVLSRLGYDLFDYDIFKAYLILEESTAERIIRDFIIPVFTPEIKNKIRTIAAQGTSDVQPKFNDLLRLFMYVHRSQIYKDKAWVICDGDPTGVSTITELKKKFESWDETHFLNFKESDFEKYYPKRFNTDVDEIILMKNGKPKQEAKKNLLEKVLHFISEQQNEAIDEFSKSASEVIEKLKSIASLI